MIESFKQIGQILLKDIDFNNLIIEDKLKILKLNSFKVKKIHKNNKKVKNEFGKEKWISEDLPVHTISVNFDLINKQIIIDQEKQSMIIDEYPFLKNKSSRGSKIVFYTNNLTYFLRTNKQKFLSIKDFIDISNNKELNDYLIQIIDTFFLKTEEGDYIIDYKLIKNPELNKVFEAYIEEYVGNEKTFIELFDKGIKNYLKASNNPNSFILKINGKSILDTEFKESYIDTIFNFYYSDVLSNNMKNPYVQKINLPMKYFNMDKKEFSFNNKSQFEKSLPLTTKEHFYIVTGMNYIKNNFKQYYGQNVSFMIIPQQLNKNELKHLNSVLTEILGVLNFKTHKLEKTVKDLDEFKEDNFIFNLVFYEEQNNYFNILIDINDLSLIDVNRIKNLFYIINSNFKEYKDNKNYSLNISSFESVFFLKSKNYRKDIFYIIKCLYKSLPLSRQMLIENLLNVSKHNYYGSTMKYLPDNIFNSIFLLKFLKENKNIFDYGGDSMDNKLIDYKIENSDLSDFLENMDITNKYIQGLICFGYLINNIIYNQNKKSEDSNGIGRSSTFIKKVGIDGLDKQELIDLFNSLKEYEEIYNISKYNNPERVFVGLTINLIEKSNLTNAEINYYVLLGIDISKYIAFKRINENKEEVDKDDKE